MVSPSSSRVSSRMVTGMVAVEEPAVTSTSVSGEKSVPEVAVPLTV